MGILSKDDILGAEDIKTMTVPVPEWGGEVLVKTLTGAERDRFEQSIIDSDRKVVLTDARARLCAMSMVDKDGKRLFANDCIAALGEKSGAVLDRIYEVASQLSGMGKEDLEDMVKNSAIPGQEDGSTSS